MSVKGAKMRGVRLKQILVHHFFYIDWCILFPKTKACMPKTKVGR